MACRSLRFAESDPFGDSNVRLRFSFEQSFLSQYLATLFLLYALGLVGNGVGPIPYGSVVSHWFDTRRGLALGLMMIGIGSGAMILPSFAQRLIARFGWRSAYAILGGAVLLIAIPVLATLLKERPQDLGLLPDGAPLKNCMAGNETAAQGPAHTMPGTAEHFGSWCALSLSERKCAGCLVHTTAMLSDRGITAQTAALGSSLVGAARAARARGNRLLLTASSLLILRPSLAAPPLESACSGWAQHLSRSRAGSLSGWVWRRRDLIAYLVSRYFGLRAFGSVYSSAFAAFALAGALGPLIIGAGFDLTGSYRVPLMAFLAATLLAALLMTRLGPYRYHPLDLANPR